MTVRLRPTLIRGCATAAANKLNKLAGVLYVFPKPKCQPTIISEMGVLCVQGHQEMAVEAWGLESWRLQVAAAPRFHIYKQIDSGER